jgi:hypothetical protein
VIAQRMIGEVLVEQPDDEGPASFTYVVRARTACQFQIRQAK